MAEEIEAPKEVESQGKIHYKLEYDFTTQELKVTVRNHFKKENHETNISIEKHDR